MTKGTYRPWGNARDLLNNQFPIGWKYYPNTPEFIPEVGDIVVYSKGIFDNRYGHTALVHSNPTMQSMIVVEQNWNSKADLPCKLRKDYYNGVTGFWRPAYN